MGSATQAYGKGGEEMIPTPEPHNSPSDTSMFTLKHNLRKSTTQTQVAGFFEGCDQAGQNDRVRSLGQVHSLG